MWVLRVQVRVPMSVSLTCGLLSSNGDHVPHELLRPCIPAAMRKKAWGVAHKLQAPRDNCGRHG